jgi:hypothetical protein
MSAYGGMGVWPQPLDRAVAWLLGEASPRVGQTVPMPMRRGGVKAPMFKHADEGSWSWASAREFASEHPDHADWPLLLDGVLVVDADDEESVAYLEGKASSGEVPELRDCPVQETRKGRHYVFARPEFADREGYWDGARQAPDRPGLGKLSIDVKTRCSTGTRGVLCVAPSPDKRWKEGRAPWDAGVVLHDAPRGLLRLVATPRRVPPPSGGGGSTRASEDMVPRTPPASTAEAPALPRATHTAAEVARACGMAAGLSLVRADCEATWKQVGWCLHNIASGSAHIEGSESALLSAWEEFSRKSAKFVPGECGTLWRAMRTRIDCPALGYGSLMHWTREDAPGNGLVESWLDGVQPHPPIASPPVEEAFRSEAPPAVAAAQARIPDLAAALARIPELAALGDAEVASLLQVHAHPEGVRCTYLIRTSDQLSARSCVVQRDGRTVVASDGSGRKLGHLFDTFPVTSSLCFVHREIPSEAEYDCTIKPTGDAELLARAPYESMTIALRNMDAAQPLQCIDIALRPKARPVRSQKRASLAGLAEAMRVGMALHAASAFGLTPEVLCAGHRPGASEAAGAGAADVAGAGETAAEAVDVLRDRMMRHAASERLRKLGDHVWRPVSGAPCAYERGETFQEFVNELFVDEPMYYARTTRTHDELLKYLRNYNPPEMRNIVRDRDLLSFSNGVLRLRDARFVPISPPGLLAPEELTGRIARHHIPHSYTGEIETPLMDKLLACQFEEGDGQVETLYALMGRLLYRVKERDNWQVMVMLVGRAGSGESTVLNVVHALIGLHTTGELDCNNEETQWTVPQIAAGNAMLDYDDASGQNSRSVVRFAFNRTIAAERVNPHLEREIIERELPNLVARCLGAYDRLLARSKDRCFWAVASEALREAQGEAIAASSLVYRFLTAVPDDSGGRYVRLVPGSVTEWQAFKEAFAKYVKYQHPGASSAISTNDVTPFERLGYSLLHVNVCKGCRKPATPGCCPLYSKANRVKRWRVVGMELVREATADKDDGLGF